ncbi:MAG: hypothetical protein ACNYPF_05445 [Candidatus Puniceispirillales bacterium WSBS_2018_MAG_OTU23]
MKTANLQNIIGLVMITVDVLKPFLIEMGFNSLLKTLSTDGDGSSFAPNNAPSNNAILPPNIEQHYELVTSQARLQSWIETAQQAGVVAVDTETTSLTASAAMLVGISMSVIGGNACYIPLRHGIMTHDKKSESQASFDLSSDSDPSAGSDPSGGVMTILDGQLDPKIYYY